VIAGGKFTTFRLMAEQLVDRLVIDLREKGIIRDAPPCRTADRRCHGAPDPAVDSADFDGWLVGTVASLRRTTGLPEDCCLHLCDAYGTAASDVGALAAEDPALGERIGEGRPFVMAEVVHAARREMCVDATDFLVRRTPIRFLEHQGLDVVEKVGKLLGTSLGWDTAIRQQQVERYRTCIRAAIPRLFD
jgi:glycerol-3-phosphate dehydrogenase